MGIFEKFKFGFKKSAENIKSGLREIIVKKEIDDETLDKIEEFLISSDVGIDASSEIKDIIAQKKIDPKNDPINEVNKILEDYIIQLMEPLEKKEFFSKKDYLNIILISGVNGVGKTTTIGKIGKIFTESNNKVVFSACDTFRAAAIEQLEEWSNRVGAKIIKSNPGADPASVAFKALEFSIKEKADYLIVDTAGRLQNKTGLMDELSKICRVISKLNANAPHNKIVVLDGTVGQNAHSQVKNFNEQIQLTGMIITKLDGSAKGGVIVSLAEQFKLPIFAVGVGEKVDDLDIFKADDYSKALLNLE